MNSIAQNVPVIVDAIKNLDHEITRCIYFTIDAVLPESPSLVTIDSVNIPLLIIGLTGIICQPDHNNTLFENPDQIDSLFNRIEDMEGTIVSVSDIIFPTSILKINEKGPRRGDVYRVGHKLMYLSYLFQTERIEYKDYFIECEEHQQQVKSSPLETRTFRTWSKLQIDRSIENYHILANKDRVMSWKESK